MGVHIGKGFFIVLLGLLLAGCSPKDPDLPVYEMVEEPGYYYLYVDEIMYRYKTYREDRSEMDLLSQSGRCQWLCSEGIGENIGTYNRGSRIYGVYAIGGDEHRDFLYSQLTGFQFGPLDGRFWLREGVELGEPDIGMVSEIIIEDKDGEILERIKDTDRIQELLDAYENGNRILQTENADDWQLYTLALCHTDYPFLRYEIEGIFSPSQELAGCHNDYSKGRESLELPEDWVKIFRDIKTEG